MSDMISRMARAMRDRDIDWYIARAPDVDPDVIRKAAMEDLKENYEALARAALEAMKEPTPAMLIAGVKAMRNDDLDVTEKELLLGWNAMIDKAMEE
ncbi:MAG: hypothetical protein M9939_00580 [Mesorhizobium sp.]|nr:hypothetical protein [Mesorhizobium sp.]MCO5159602.1 hypothetical protein [Mesorhizobium sp.]